VQQSPFEGILKSNPKLGNEWLVLLLSLPSEQLRWFKDFALVVSANMMKFNEETAMNLLKVAIDSEAFVHRMYSDELSLEQKAIWSCPRATTSETLWKKRFEGCVTDHTLALEVLAAERFGAEEFVRDYATELSASERPIDRALAVIIAGFSIQYEYFQPYLNAVEPTAGLVGTASKAARAAHEKALWAQLWIDQMWAAETPEQFWTKLTLAAKIVDARHEYASNIYQSANRWAQFASIFTRERTDRIKKMERPKREEILR
jgi:hypothetical protein